MKPSFQFAAEVQRWVDGDSVVLRLDLGFSISVTESCRLLGIDTSETRGRDKELKWLGNLAKQYVNDVCPVGSDVIVRTHKAKRGKFGRVLCEIFQGEGTISLNETLKLQRLAVPYFGQSKREVLQLHQECVEYHKAAGNM